MNKLISLHRLTRFDNQIKRNLQVLIFVIVNEKDKFEKDKFCRFNDYISFVSCRNMLFEDNF